MPCTTILVGKNASYDGSTLTARNDDGNYDVKKAVVIDPARQKKTYKSVIAHLTITLPDNPLSYTCCPNVDLHEGIWPAAGINSLNVGMTATETVTTNPRVLGGDPFVRYRKATTKKEKDIPGGIGEEDLVVLVLPYIRSAREGVERLGRLLEEYGTYESNGIAFNDKDEIWWMETIGGHHWIARRVDDNEVVIMPNQFGLDRFDFDDAFGAQKENLCSKDLKEFIEKNHLDCGTSPYEFNPRLAFGSHSDADHVYNTPRAWYMGRCLCPTRYDWDGPDADYTPLSDDIPWSFIPERKVTVEDIKYILSSHYQGTPYDPYSKGNDPRKGIYRPIGKNNTGEMVVNQIRPYAPEQIRAVEWVCFGSTTFDSLLPVYTNVSKLPAYLSDVTMDISTDNFYWNSRLLGALTDPCYSSGIIHIERYEMKMMSMAHEIIAEYDRKFAETGDMALIAEANEKLCAEGKKLTAEVLKNALGNASSHMRNGYNRGDN